MAFRFSLQEVLEHRETLEAHRQREYGEALGRVQGVRRELSVIERDVQRGHQRIRQLQLGDLSLADRDLIERWLAGRRIDAEHARRRIDQLAAEAEAKRLELVEAVKARTILEKLRDRELEEHRQAEAREEMKFFDEIAVREFIAERRREKDAGQAERIAR